MGIVTINKLENDVLDYKVLTDKDKYYAGTQQFDWLEDTHFDSFRVGYNGEGEFCIEDSIGRFIPFRLEDIDNLIDVLMTYRQENDKAIEIEKLHNRIRELENGS